MKFVILRFTEKKIQKIKKSILNEDSKYKKNLWDFFRAAWFDDQSSAVG